MTVTPEHQLDRLIANYRQGSLFEIQDNPEIKSKYSIESNMVLVISHDCDITANNCIEPCIEVLETQILLRDQRDGSKIYGANPRELHLPIIEEGVEKYLKLNQTRKLKINKSDANSLFVNGEIAIEEKNKKMLQAWLAARYKRHAFPEALTPRLDPLRKKIETYGKNVDNSEGIIALFIRVSPEEELPKEDIYEVDIIIVYEVESEKGRKSADLLNEKIQAVFDENSKEIKGTIKIRSDVEFTIKDARSFVEWRFEYLSYRGEDVGAVMP